MVNFHRFTLPEPGGAQPGDEVLEVSHSYYIGPTLRVREVIERAETQILKCAMEYL